MDLPKRQDPDFKSLHQFFLRAANEIHSPDRTYLFRKEGDVWAEYSYKKMLEFIDSITAWFVEIGLQKGDRVAVILENCPEYFAIDQSLQKLGLVNVSIYPTLTPEETKFILNDSGAKILFTGNAFQLKKFNKIKEECPAVFCTVHIPSDIEETKDCKNYTSMLEEGKHLFHKHNQEIEKRFSEVGHQDLSTLIYTSGTTGVPKGAMLTHYNFMSNCYDAIDLCPAVNKTDKFLSFLPLSHVTASGIWGRFKTVKLSVHCKGKINLPKIANPLSVFHILFTFS